MPADTFKLVYVQVGTDLDVSLSHKDTTWSEEKNDKFRNPSLKNVENNTLQGAYKSFASPPNWQKAIYELSPYESDNNANLNSDLIVWLRTSAFPTFRKLYRRIVHTGSHFAKGLPKGSYRMDLKYSILSSISRCACTIIGPLTYTYAEFHRVLHLSFVPKHTILYKHLLTRKQDFYQPPFPFVRT